MKTVRLQVLAISAVSTLAIVPLAQALGISPDGSTSAAGAVTGVVSYYFVLARELRKRAG